jgi:hypothetical protein
MGQAEQSAEAIPTIEKLFGLDLSADSIPPLPHQVARSLWGKGDYRAAYSLLYRASLQRLVASEVRLPLSSADTEQECVRKVQHLGLPSVASNYFEQLTMQWLALAYGNRIPTAEQFQAILNAWPAFEAHTGRISTEGDAVEIH